MSNLFSIFDPVVLSLSLNWISALTAIVLLPNLFWLLKNQIFRAITILTNFLFQELSAVLGQLITPGGTFLCIRLFIFIVANNFLGLFPYTFTASSHLTFTVSLALPLWLGHIFMAWFTTPQNILAHLVPLGTPYALTPFIVVIEIVSNIIRPLTLSVRLAANIVAGHLLLTLLSSQALSPSFLVSSVVLSALVLLGVLETAVALIQAYVFRILSTLYLNEVNSFPIN